MNLVNRVKKLEGHSATDQHKVTLVLVAPPGNYEGMDSEARTEAIALHRQESDAQEETAISDYMATHEDCSQRDIDIITVIDEKTKLGVESLLRGEGRE